MRRPPEPGNRARHERGLQILLVLATALTLALGVSKLLVQRAYPPPYVAQHFHRYEGFVSIDQYCLRAEKFRDRIYAAPDERGAAQARLMQDLESGYLPTAVLVPAILGAISRWTGSIPVTFACLSAGALLAQLGALLALGAHLGRRHGGRVVGWTAAVLLVGHVDAMRASAQLLIDPFAAALASGCVLFALRRRAGGRGTVALLAIQVLGPFVKLTYAPLLAAPAVIELVCAGERRLARAVRAGLLFGVLPALPAVLYLLWIPGAGAFSSEMVRAVDSSSLTARELRHFALEMAFLFQVLPLLYLLGRHAAREVRSELDGVALATLVFVASVMGIQLPDDYRLYLPAVGLLAALAAPGAVHAAGRRLVPALACYVLANGAVAAYGLWSQIPR